MQFLNARVVLFPDGLLGYVEVLAHVSLGRLDWSSGEELKVGVVKRSFTIFPFLILNGEGELIQRISEGPAHQVVILLPNIALLWLNNSCNAVLTSLTCVLGPQANIAGICNI